MNTNDKELELEIYIELARNPNVFIHYNELYNLVNSNKEYSISTFYKICENLPLNYKFIEMDKNNMKLKFVKYDNSTDEVLNMKKEIDVMKNKINELEQQNTILLNNNYTNKKNLDSIKLDVENIISNVQIAKSVGKETNTMLLENNLKIDNITNNINNFTNNIEIYKTMNKICMIFLLCFMFLYYLK
jgi:hypothetical protein